ncbi:MAG: DUF2927 domain-containing protein [Pseudomonadota bacterium]
MKSFKASAPASQRISNADLVVDFIDLSFALESGRALPVLTRFEGPISLRVTGRPPPTLNADLTGLLGRLRREAGINITKTSSASANVTVEAVPRAAIQKALPQAACFVAPNVRSLAEYRSERRRDTTNWALLRNRTHLTIVLPNDASPQETRDCLHEELAQALGPLNDLYRLPNSVFNDDNVHTVLTDFDMLILRATYAPELANGMSKEMVARALPKVFARIHPAGQFSSTRRVSRTPSAYARAIETALGPGVAPAQRRRAANQAVKIASDMGWKDNRRGFAHYARGRVLQNTNASAAVAEFRLADRIYAADPQTQLHRAFVATQLGAYALAKGDTKGVSVAVTPYIPTAKSAQNAALLATLQLLKAEALQIEGRVQDANAIRLDSLGWARYGFGSDWAVEARLREIASLRPSPDPV